MSAHYPKDGDLIVIPEAGEPDWFRAYTTEYVREALETYEGVVPIGTALAIDAQREKIKELERRIRELEARPQVVTYPVPSYQPPWPYRGGDPPWPYTRWESFITSDRTNRGVE